MVGLLCHRATLGAEQLSPLRVFRRFLPAKLRTLETVRSVDVARHMPRFETQIHRAAATATDTAIPLSDRLSQIRLQRALRLRRTQEKRRFAALRATIFVTPAWASPRTPCGMRARGKLARLRRLVGSLPSSSGLGRGPLKAQTRVRFPLGAPSFPTPRLPTPRTGPAAPPGAFISRASG